MLHWGERGGGGHSEVISSVLRDTPCMLTCTFLGKHVLRLIAQSTERSVIRQRPDFHACLNGHAETTEQPLPSDGTLVVPRRRHVPRTNLSIKHHSRCLTGSVRVLALNLSNSKQQKEKLAGQHLSAECSEPLKVTNRGWGCKKRAAQS